jgi:hypothetical protein
VLIDEVLGNFKKYIRIQHPASQMKCVGLTVFGFPFIMAEQSGVEWGTREALPGTSSKPDYWNASI